MWAYPILRIRNWEWPSQVPKNGSRRVILPGPLGRDATSREAPALMGTFQMGVPSPHHLPREICPSGGFSPLPREVRLSHCSVRRAGHVHHCWVCAFSPALRRPKSPDSTHPSGPCCPLRISSTPKTVFWCPHAPDSLFRALAQADPLP